MPRFCAWPTIRAGAVQKSSRRLAQDFYLGFIVIHAQNPVTHFSKAHCRYQAHISGPITQMETGFDIRRPSPPDIRKLGRNRESFRN